MFYIVSVIIVGFCLDLHYHCSTLCPYCWLLYGRPVSYSTEVFFTYQETYECGQYYWLLDDLVQANENRHNVPWIVAVGHRPMYCSNDNGDDCTGLPFRGRVRAG